jgi:hypothetical protein
MRVFVSSTIADLGAFRAQVERVLTSARHKVVNPYSASSSPTVAALEKEVKSCDVFVLIQAYYYGKKIDRDLSYTEFEYNTAVSHDRLVLVFQANADFMAPSALEQSTAGRHRQEHFRKRAGTEHRAEVFGNSKQDLATAVLVAVNEHQIPKWSSNDPRSLPDTFVDRKAARGQTEPKTRTPGSPHRVVQRLRFL